MRFVFYSEKSVAQCLSAINARMHVKGTASRPGLDGWVEKGGAFALGTSSKVIGKFSRKTYLRAKVERENGVTVIRGSVPSGVSLQGQAVVYVALALVALVIIGSGNVVYGLLLVPFAAYLYIPMRGDYLNSEMLIDDVRKTLKARPTPPKKSTSEAKTVKPAVARPAAVSRPGTPRPLTAPKKSSSENQRFSS